MKIDRRAFIVAALGVGGAGVASRLATWDETTDRDRTPAPMPPQPPDDAAPTVAFRGLLPGGRPCVKPTIAVDGGRAMVVAIDVAGGTEMGLACWTSGDGGRHWGDPAPIATWPAGSRAMFDPWLLTDHRGRFHLVHASVAREPVADRSPVVFRRSIDDGVSWGRPERVAGIGDRPMLGIGPGGRRLAIACAMVDPASLPTLPLRSPDEASAAIARIRRLCGIFVSGDRGRSWSPVAGPEGMIHGIPFGVACDDGDRIACCWIDSDGKGSTSRSLACTTVDGGRTWETTTLVERLQPDREHGFNGGRSPVLAQGGGGTLHLAYVGANGKGLSVRSSRDWRAWGEAIPLASDAAEEVRFPSIAARGPMVHATWMERRGGRYRMWYRGSKDRGASWPAPILLDPPTAPDSPEDGGFYVSSDDDQASVADDGAGTAHAVWAARASAGGTLEVRHAVIAWKVAEPSGP